jgi:hypothetical protein
MRYKSSMLLPPFNEEGLLHPGVYSLSLDELRTSYLVTGDGCGQEWDSDWRQRLVNGLETLAKQLWTVGIENIFIDGSFVEAKDHPNDIDGYFECDLRYFVSGKLIKDLNLLDPYKVWTWSPKSLKPARNSIKAQLPMWRTYRVELYPHCIRNTGIMDEHGNELTFPSAFRQRRSDSQPKGIILLRRGNAT